MPLSELALLLALPFLRAGLAQEVQVPDDRYGTIVVEPGPGEIEQLENEVFEYSVEYRPGPQGLPPGWALLIYPIMNRGDLRSIRFTRDTDLEILVDGYTSRSVRSPGGFGLYRITSPADVAARRPGKLSISATLGKQFYGRQSPCVVAVDVVLVDEQGKPLHFFETPQWSRATQPVAKLQALLPSQARPNRRVPLLLSFSSRQDNPVYEPMGKVSLRLPEGCRAAAQEIEIRAEDRGVRRVAVSFTEPGLYRIGVATDGTSGAPRFEVLSNPIVVSEEPQRIAWGDLQNHTVFSFDSRTRADMHMDARELIADARDRFALDYVVLSDHAQSSPVLREDEKPAKTDMRRGDWKIYREQVIGAPYEGIICFLGFEQNDYRGHTVMMHRLDGPYPQVDEHRVVHHQYWAMTEAQDLLSIPHLHTVRQIGRFDRISPSETVIEVYDQHGAFEYYGNQPDFPVDSAAYGREITDKHDRNPRRFYVRDLLNKGFQYGLVASSDHGTAGALGLTAVRVDALDRDAIFDAIRERRCYATTGARMLLEFAVSGHSMGSVVSVESGDELFGSRTIELEVHASAPIQLVQIIRNGSVLHEQEGSGELDLVTSFRDDEDLLTVLEERKIGPSPTTYYYLRVVQEDAHIGWGSPVFLNARN